MNIFVNRTLSLRKIKAIGFDMDYTLVQYKAAEYEGFIYAQVINTLIQSRKYPEVLRTLKYDAKRIIQGLIIDKKRGNILKLSRHGKVRISYHGTQELEFSKQQEIYNNKVIDLNDPHIQIMDTAFSIAHGVLYGQIVDLKDLGHALPSYEQIAEDLINCIDTGYRDGSFQRELRKDLSRYIIQDEQIVRSMERFKKSGKRLLVITNSPYNYTKLLLDYAFNPFLKDHKDWTELFEIVITLSTKPKFFTDKQRFLKIDPATGMMSNLEGSVVPGIYQGGNANTLQKDLKLHGEEILYIGDHIFGDVVSIKKSCNWRTALVLAPLADEIKGLQAAYSIKEKIADLNDQKHQLEIELDHILLEKIEGSEENRKVEISKIRHELDIISKDLSALLFEYNGHFNPYWGEMMRAGMEESRFANQVEKYACIYMATLGDFLGYSPKFYFRPTPRLLAHEVHLEHEYLKNSK